VFFGQERVFRSMQQGPGTGLLTGQGSQAAAVGSDSRGKQAPFTLPTTSQRLPGTEPRKHGGSPSLQTVEWQETRLWF